MGRTLRARVGRLQSPPPMSGEHFYATDAEIAAWTSRMNNGPYRVAGDVSANSPGDWTRASGNAENFRSNPTQGRYVQPGTGYIAVGDPWPGEGSSTAIENVSRVSDAAFVAMVKNDIDLLTKCKTELLWQVREWSTSSLNYSRWDPNYHGAWPSPMFVISRWVQMWLMVYDRIGRDQFTASEKAEIEEWLHKHSNYFAYLVNREAIKRFSNRWSEDWSDAPSTSVEDKPYDNPEQLIGWLSRMHNNRAMSIGAPSAVIAAYLRAHDYVVPTTNPPPFGLYTTDQLYKNGWLYFNEHLRFSVFPHGFQGDFERGTDGYHKGLGYSTAVAAAMCEIADAYHRRGDNRLFDLVTTDGKNGTQGAPTLSGFTSGKSLEFYLVSISRYIDDKWGRRWDGYELHRDDDIADVQHARANRYYQNAYLKRIYMRTEPGSPPYPASPASIGGWGSENSWRGHNNISPGILFECGQMEGVS